LCRTNGFLRSEGGGGKEERRIGREGGGKEGGEAFT